MRYAILLWNYLRWHYGAALGDLFVNYRNIAVFLVNFFSLTFLLRTLFSPWKRLGEGYPSIFKFGEFLTVATVNGVMRILGFFLRLIILVIGVIVLLASGLLFVSLLLIWLTIPLLFLGIALAGCTLLASYL